MSTLTREIRAMCSVPFDEPSAVELAEKAVELANLVEAAEVLPEAFDLRELKEVELQDASLSRLHCQINVARLEKMMKDTTRPAMFRLTRARSGEAYAFVAPVWMLGVMEIDRILRDEDEFTVAQPRLEGLA